MGRLSAGLWAALAAIAGTQNAAAQEVTLRALSAFGEGTFFSRNFERFIDKVNAEGKGTVQIRFIGGPKAMPPMEVGNAIRSGVVDLANIPSAFYFSLMPEADAQKLARISQAEQRKNGAWDYLNRLHNEKVNAWYLVRQHSNVQFHLYSNKPVKSADLSGLKLRVTPVYQAFFASLGAQTVTTAPGEVYTALDRGVVDGYGWPSLGVFDLNWHEKTKFRLDPPFYAVDVAVLINLDKWRSLNPRQQKFLADAAQWLEGLDRENEALIAKELGRQKEVGIQSIRLSSAEEKRFIDQAYEVGWQQVIKRSPVHGPKLRELLDRK
jgi:TRAP-type C4-dicarboxylate transport system substrate-binding protein